LHRSISIMIFPEATVSILFFVILSLPFFIVFS
jgi:hypothetical protein